MSGAGSEFEGAPCVVETIGVGEANVAASSSELGVPQLHPHDLLVDASLCGDGHSDGEAAHAALAAEAGERGSWKPIFLSVLTTIVEIRAAEGTGSSAIV